jgi:peptide chain release factor subunit 1
MITNLENLDLKLLSEIHDEESKDTYITLFVDLKDFYKRFLTMRISSCRSIFKKNKELLKNFDKTMEMAMEYIEKSPKVKGQKSIAIFASDTHNFFRAYKLSLPVDNMLIADSSPYIRPLARLVDDYETFGLLVMDQQRAKIYIVSSGKIDFQKRKAKDIMNKHKKGGWSQQRFARLRKGAIDKFMKEVAADIEKIFLQDHVAKVVIAGPGSAKTQFQEYLSQQLREKIVDTMEVSFDEAEGALVTKASEIVIADEMEEDVENVRKWREEILREGLAVYGERETKVAVQNGQVELLLVSKDHKTLGWKCEHCQFMDKGTADECPYCGGEANEVDLIEEIVEEAILQDTDIDFIESHPELDELGGVGGLLRYK